MISGSVTERFPRVFLPIVTESATVEVEFIVDTAFDGELSLPPEILLRLDLKPSGRRSLMLADGTLTRTFYYRVPVQWNEEVRLTEILLLDANPLLGVEMLMDSLLEIEMTSRGEIRIEDL